MRIELSGRKAPSLQYFTPCGRPIGIADGRVGVNPAELRDGRHERRIVELRPSRAAAEDSEHQEQRDMADSSHLMARLPDVRNRVNHN